MGGMHPNPDPVPPGGESVWSYPRPPALQAVAARLRIVHGGATLADTVRGFRVLETSHPPTYYFPSDDVAPGVLLASPRGGSWCEWKGAARYWDVTVPGAVPGAMLDAVAWSYPDPSAPFAGLKDHVAFYAAPFDACFVGEARASPQPGGFYGGWVTPELGGPFKGVPGSRFW